LSDVGEHGWIRGLVRRAGKASGALIVGPGDDAAALRAPRGTVLLTTDTLVEGVHFRREWLSPRALGRRAFRVNASDVAAMGGRPWAVLLAIEAPASLPVATLDGIVDGVARDARAAGAVLAGGNLARAERLAIAVALVGVAGRTIVRRAGACVGDVLAVTGPLGAMGAAVRARLAGRAVRLPDVPCRWAVGERLAPFAHAMIDVSDGLVQDAGHLCRASGVGAEIDLAAVPVAAACRRALGADAARFAVGAGEDYELLVALRPRAVRAARRAALRHGVGLSIVGRVVPGAPRVRLRNPDGTVAVPSRSGFDHFRRWRASAR
jgi:thiamine-monophosphate kinase